MKILDDANSVTTITDTEELLSVPQGGNINRITFAAFKTLILNHLLSNINFSNINGSLTAAQLPAQLPASRIVGEITSATLSGSRINSEVPASRIALDGSEIIDRINDSNSLIDGER
ncbi:MAG: hypothetical protein LBS50_11280, partial [Prevotellaceae bacterium]|nr:hypothetical protein [Prevotellaceae bacterium]